MDVIDRVDEVEEEQGAFGGFDLPMSFENPVYEPDLDNLPSTSQYDPDQDLSSNQHISLKLDAYYKSQGYNKIPDGVDFSRFKIENNHLKYLKDNGELTYLTDRRNFRKFVKPVTSKLQAEDKSYLFPTVRLPENIEMTVLQGDRLETQPTTISETNVDGATTEMTHNLSQVQTIAKNLGLTEREVLGLDQMAQTIKGNIQIQTSKLVTLEQRIESEERKLEENPNDEVAKTELRRLQGEKDATIESLNILRERANDQITAIKDTINKIKDGRLTIWERIKLIFREQGLTIGAIMTTVGLLIGLIVQATKSVVTGGSGGSGGSGGGGDGFVKRGLKNLASALKALAAKAAAALPGIIGTIVSFLLKSGAAVVSFFAEHLWAFGMAVGFVIYQVFINNTDIGKKVENKRQEYLKSRQKN